LRIRCGSFLTAGRLEESMSWPSYAAHSPGSPDRFDRQGQSWDYPWV
jgi:hypothetical protein